MKYIIITLLLASTAQVFAQQDTTSVVEKESAVQEVTITNGSTVRRMAGAANGFTIGRQELFKAACCNLGESFTTNPSVDVSYSDAATGAKQIKLLGLSGTYVQMLTEQLPDFRGAALPYALDYVPGTWMNSIQVSKGAGTVKNGYEGITGQIDIEYMKPNDTEQLNVNLYGNSLSRAEANFDANLHLSNRLSTVLMGHYDNDFGHHDDNDDGFMDTPNRRQWNLMNRWKLVTDSYIMHAGLSAIKERREGGQTAHTARHLAASPAHLYQTLAETDRYEAYMKHAFILNPERQENIALMTNAALHLQDAHYGLSLIDNNEKTLNAQLMYEVNLTDMHQLSLGTSLSHYYSKLHVGEVHDHTTHQGTHLHDTEHETTEGVYAQYTLTAGTKLTAMAGIRADYSDLWHWFLTPRLHVKYAPADLFSLRGSLGRGYRTPHFWAENHFLLASSRDIVINDSPQQEKAWNMGLSTAWNIPLAGQTLKLNAEYYYTTFQQQQVVNYTDYPNPATALSVLSPAILVSNLDGRSYSHTLQLDATYPVAEGLTATAAWRWNDVKCTYLNTHTGQNELLQKPLTSRFKGLLSLSYKPGMGIWQFDATLQFNGGGRIVADERFHSYEQLQAQITRDFRHFSVYLGGENLTNFRQKDPVRGATDPWGDNFDATLVWGPVHGRVIYAGLRFNLEY